MQFTTLTPVIERHIVKAMLIFGLSLTLAACENGEGFNLDFLKKKPETENGAAVATANADGVVEQDVEAPEVFSVNENGLWDGRPSLGGVWVAYPDVKDPERVIIRNADTGKSVVGALFRRERLNPGPKLQVSSDAAVELGMLAGQPAKLSVVALKKEEIKQPVVAPVEGVEEVDVAAATAEIEAQPLDPVDVASSAIERAAPTPKPEVDAVPTPAPVAATPAPQATSLPNPFIQIGIFSNKSNADAASDSLREAGMIPTIKSGENNGSTFYRVIVGPAANVNERKVLLTNLQELGFQDAYFVNN
ncbi:MAG: SPOR domain-containing protein [Pseudomonadota bacterium]